MKLVLVPFTLFAVCYADKLDRRYLPPIGAPNAGGSPGAIQAPGSGSSNYLAPTLSVGPPSSSPSQATTSFGGTLNPKPKHSVTQDSGSYSEPFQTVPSQFSIEPSGTHSSSQGSSYSGASQAGQTQHPSASLLSSENSQSGVSDFGPSGPAFGSNGPVQSSATKFAERPQATFERNAGIIRQHNDITADGFSYAFETDNGISAEESGVATNGVQAHGGYSYTGDDGRIYSVTYTADENGYRPQGDHLPTPPPIPEAILKSLEFIAQAQNAGMSQDGFYDHAKYHGSGNDRTAGTYGERNTYPLQDANNFKSNGQHYQASQPENDSSISIFGAAPKKNYPQYNGFSHQSSFATPTNRPNQYTHGAAVKTNTQQQNNLPNLQTNIVMNQNGSPFSHYGSLNKELHPSSAQHSAPALQNQGKNSQFVTSKQQYNGVENQNNSPVPEYGVPFKQPSTPTVQHIPPAHQNQRATSQYGVPEQQYNVVPTQNNSPVPQYEVPTEQPQPSVAQHSTPVQQNQGLSLQYGAPEQYEQQYNDVPNQNNSPVPEYEVSSKQPSTPAEEISSSAQQKQVATPQYGAPQKQYNEDPNQNDSPVSQYPVPNEQPQPSVAQHSTPVQQKQGVSPQYGAPEQQYNGVPNQNNFPVSEYVVPSKQPSTPAVQYIPLAHQNQGATPQYGPPEQQYNGVPNQNNSPGPQYQVLTEQPQSSVAQHSAPVQQNLGVNPQYGAPEQYNGVPNQNNSPVPEYGVPTKQLNTPEQPQPSVAQHSTLVQQNQRVSPQYGAPEQHEQQYNGVLNQNKSPVAEYGVPSEQPSTPTVQYIPSAHQNQGATPQYGPPEQQYNGVPNQNNFPVPQHQVITEQPQPSVAQHSTPVQQNLGVNPQYSALEQQNGVPNQNNSPVPEYGVPTKQPSTPEQPQPSVAQHSTLVQQNQGASPQYSAPEQQYNGVPNGNNSPVTKYGVPFEQPSIPAVQYISSAHQNQGGNPQYEAPKQQLNGNLNINNSPVPQLVEQPNPSATQQSAPLHRNQGDISQYGASEQQYNGVPHVKESFVSENGAPAGQPNASAMQYNIVGQQNHSPSQPHTVSGHEHFSSPEYNAASENNDIPVPQYHVPFVEQQAAPFIKSSESLYGKPAQITSASSNTNPADHAESPSSSFGSPRAPPTFDAKTGYKY